MKSLFTSILFLTLFWHFGYAQMSVNGQSLYGNEWIDHDAEYYKIKVAQDGIYQVDYETLIAAGVPMDNVKGAQLQLYYRGSEVPMITSTQESWDQSDYLRFYGQRNDGYLEQYINNGGINGLLNPEYSLYSDTSAYYLTWRSDTDNARYAILDEIDDPSTLTELPYYMHTEQVVFSDAYYKPVFQGNDRVRYSNINQSEGYGQGLMKDPSVSFDVTSLYADGPDARVNIRFGNNVVNHIVHLRYNGATVDTTGLFSANKVKQLGGSIPTSELSSNPKFQLVNALNPSTEKSIISVAELVYPRAFAFPDTSFTAFSIGASATAQVVRISEFVSGESPILLDMTNRAIIPLTKSGDDWLAGVAASVQDRDFILYNSDEAVESISSLTQTSFIDYTQINPEYVILTSKKLHQPGQTGVQSYVDYRSSTDGGGYDVALVFAEDLYDQFAYGVDQHAISLTNFSQFIRDHWTNGQYNFVIGKAFEYQEMRWEEQYADRINEFMVPTFGSPGSDNMLFASKGSSIPYIPTGRLAARNDQDVLNYLDKIKLHENPIDNDQTLEDQLWKKEIIHLSGGDANLLTSIFNSLEIMRNIAERSKFGANVTTFRKTSNDVLQSSLTTEIISKIDAGVSLITFFGHSAVGTFDFSLENPSLYNNTGKLPLIISLGCYSGNIHTGSFGLSESFVLEKDRGALAFLAASSTAYFQPQKSAGIDYYRFFSDIEYGSPVGTILRESLTTRDQLDGIDNITLNQQLTLHGDPAIRLHPRPGPDYVVDYESIQTEPAIIGTSEASFDINFDVFNLGTIASDSIDILGVLELPDGTIADSVTTRIASPKYKSATTLTFDMPGISARGKNKIYIEIDRQQAISELPDPKAELNNTVYAPDGTEGYCFFIVDNNATPVYPPEYGIVSTSQVELQASTSNGLAKAQDYTIELDTTETFDSPMLISKVINQEGGLISWRPDITLSDGTVYYWRISPDEQNDDDDRMWSHSSFVHISGSSPGWNQSHYYQIADGVGKQIHLVDSTRQFVYDKARQDIRIKNQFRDPEFQDWWVFVNGDAWRSINPFGITPVIGVQIWEPIEYFDFNIAEDGTHTEYGSMPWSRDLYAYHMQTTENRSHIKALIESAPEGSRIIFMTYLEDEFSDYKTEEWEADSLTLGYNLFGLLEGYGAKKVRQLKDLGTVPYTLVFDKSGGVLLEEIGQNIFDHHDVRTHFDVFFDEGTYTSTQIGPAANWSSLQWSERKNDQDLTTVKIYGKSAAGVDSLLAEVADMYEYDMSSISAEEFPYLWLEYEAIDALNTAAQLEYWRVLYDELPDAALSLQKDFAFEGDTIQQGQNLYLKIGLDHISGGNMDSVLVRFALRDASNNIINESKKYAPLMAGTSYPIVYDRSSLDLLGDYELSMTVNPDGDQPEKHSFNNFAITRFTVEADEKNPLLDVTIDGRHLRSGDVVTTTPFIEATLKDENPYLPLDDIESFELALTYPDGNPWNVPLDHESLRFVPANGINNQARLEFSPTLDQDGMYTLEVQGRDRSGNFSGEFAYEVDFRVVIPRRIENLSNFPNPFAVSTQFEFDLIGKMPDTYSIQIVSLTGMIVKEISQEEIGPLQVGQNTIGYVWDGQSDTGALVPNGVYIYRLITADDDLDPFVYGDATDAQNMDDIGKLIIVR